MKCDFWNYEVAINVMSRCGDEVEIVARRG